MQYNYEDLNRRVKGIEGGYRSLGEKMEISTERVKEILSGRTNPKLSTMTRLNDCLKKIEADEEKIRQQHAEIFLPHTVINSTLITSVND